MRPIGEGQRDHRFIRIDHPRRNPDVIFRQCTLPEIQQEMLAQIGYRKLPAVGVFSQFARWKIEDQRAIPQCEIRKIARIPGRRFDQRQRVCSLFPVIVCFQLSPQIRRQPFQRVFIE